MLMLLFYVGDQAYAMDCQHVFEIVPYIHLEKHAHPSNYVSGFANFEGRPINVVDFSQLVAERPSAFYLHTRIIFLVADNQKRLFSSLGMIAEKVIEVMECPLTDFFEPHLTMGNLPFLDGIANELGRSIQRVDVGKLIQFVGMPNNGTRRSFF
jgi:chemotaxis-related protein WspB